MALIFKTIWFCVLFTTHKHNRCISPSVHLAERNMSSRRPSWWATCRPPERQCGWAAGSWPLTPEPGWRLPDARGGWWRVRSMLSEGRTTGIQIIWCLLIFQGMRVHNYMLFFLWETVNDTEKPVNIYDPSVLYLNKWTLIIIKIGVWNQLRSVSPLFNRTTTHRLSTGTVLNTRC